MSLSQFDKSSDTVGVVLMRVFQKHSKLERKVFLFGFQYPQNISTIESSYYSTSILGERNISSLMHQRDQISNLLQSLCDEKIF